MNIITTMADIKRIEATRLFSSWRPRFVCCYCTLFNKKKITLQPELTLLNGTVKCVLLSSLVDPSQQMASVLFAVKPLRGENRYVNTCQLNNLHHAWQILRKNHNVFMQAITSSTVCMSFQGFLPNL